MRISFFLIALLYAQNSIGQINSFPYSQGFETTFTTGNNVSFLNNWEGNDVRTSSRIFQGNNPRTGAASLNIIPTSTFSGEVWISLNLTGVTNPKITFYAYSKQNGSTSTRPALLNFSTSIDGGNEFLDDTAIGDETTFPNDNLTSYSLYEYELPVTASGEPNVIVRFIAKRGDGSGSAAELIIDDFTIEEQALPLAIDNVSTKDSNTVIVTFNQEVEQTSAETTENYAFTNGITISSATKTSANVVTLTTSTLVNNTYQLTVKNMKDVATNTASADLKENFNFIIPLSIESITVQDKNTILVDFNLNLNEASAETITNYSLNNSYGNPTSSTLNLTSPDQVSLVYSSVLTENNYALTIDNVTDNSGLAAANNLNGSFSYLPLAIQNVTVTSANTIELDFNQPLDAVSSQTASNYSVNFGKGAPTTAAQSLSDASKVTLNLATNLVNNTYEITINNVANNSGNATTNNLKANAQFSTATSTRQIVINEIFADPSGANQPNPIVLPNGTSEEFVELFNTTSESIDITGFQLAGGTIGNFVLDAGAYVTLTSTTNVTAYQGFGNVVGVSTWNTLTNSGEQLILLDNLGNQVDSLTYDLSWYHDNDKSDGGWTLEQVNPELICSDGNNWIASVSSQGGTPGKINSVYDNSPDITAPSIIDVIITNDQKIEVVFDETLDAGSIAGSKFILDNDVNINSANFDPPYWRIVSLSLNPALTSGTIYNLSISGLTDCAGNNINGASFKFLFDNESPVLQRIVYKSTNLIDLIFDEEVGKTVAETESNYSINQGIGNPSKATLNSTTPHRISLQMVSDLSLGSTYTLSYQNLTDSLGNTIALSNQNFVFINDIDTVIVVSNQLLDIYFDTDVDETSAEVLTNYQADDGLGSPISAARDNTNPKLVHLIFESAFPENTTTEIQFEDIQGSTLNYLQLLNTNFTYDTDDPDVDSVVVVDENTLRIYFDEVLDETSAETINNYSANNSIGIPTEAILQPDRTSVLLNFAVNFEQEVQNRLTLTAVKDISGNAISTNRNFTFTYDRLPPRLIGIKLITPVVLAIEFSEEVMQAVAENVNNYSINNSIGNPIQVIRAAKNTNIVELTFADLGNNASNTLTISNISDLFRNNLKVNLTATFSSLLPEIGSFNVTSDTSFRIQFTKELTKTSAESISNYSIDKKSDPLKLAQESNDASVVNLMLSTTLEENVDYRLYINNLVDVDGNTVLPTTFDFTYNDKITEITFVNAYTLQIQFEEELEEALAETTTNFVLDGGIGNPLTAVLNNQDASQLTLFFDRPLVESNSFELLIKNLRNTYDEIIPSSRNAVLFDVTPPTITAINSTYNNEIEIIFNEPIDKASGTSLNHYYLNNSAGRNTDIMLTNDAKIVRLQFAKNLMDGLNYSLNVDRVKDLSGNPLDSLTFNFTFESLMLPTFRDIVINEIYFETNRSSKLPNYEFIEVFNRSNKAFEIRDFAITDKQDTAYFSSFILDSNSYLTISNEAGQLTFQYFGNAISTSNFPSLSNTGETIFLLDRDLNIIDSLQYTQAFYNNALKEDGGCTLELINPDKACFDITNYAASTNSLGGTPGAKNSVYNITPDTTTPVITMLEVLSTSELKIHFNESMDISTLVPTNFSLQNGITVSNIVLGNQFGSTITLFLNAPFQRGLQRNLDIANIQDCSGNSLKTQETFLLGSIPSNLDLLVTEIMATPAPSNGLPVREYIEIYNNGSKTLNLSNVILKEDNNTYSLKAFNLHPQEYIILTSNSGAAELASYGKTLGINSFPTLTMEDKVRLENINNELIFEVEYDKTFYQNEDKDEGGYSLEMINLNPGCFDKSNWKVTNSTIGGTPGTRNSVFSNSMDTTSPTVLQFEVISDTTLEIEFSESMNISSLMASNFNFSGGLSINMISLIEEFGRKVKIDLNSDFSPGIIYTLTLNNISDCSGNELSTTSLEFSRGATPVPGDMIITEIMANPTPVQGLPEVEYLEILNVSNQIISLSGVILADANSSTVLGNMDLDPGEYGLLAPSSAANLLTEYGKVLAVNNWPNLNNSGDIPTLYTPNAVEIHQVNFSDGWYRSSIKSAGGYSLEMIDTDYPCLEANNWIASEDLNGGTPGSINSVNGDNPDLSGPTLLQAIAVSNSTVQLTFNEKIDATSIELRNFTADNSLEFIFFQVDEAERIVTLTTSTDLVQNTLYLITAENITDCTGNLIQSNGNTAELTIAAEANQLDIIVNEIVFNPVTGGERFVEFYNNSNKYINLKGWKIAGLTNSKMITEKDLFIHPAKYFVITTDGNKIKSAYPKANETTFIEIGSMPSLPSDEGAVFIYNISDTEIDKFEYSEEYHSNLLEDTNGVSLERILFSGNSNDPSNWFSASSTDNFATPGYDNSQAFVPENQVGTVTIDPPTFAPDIAGASNFTLLNYSFDEPGNTLNIKIVDAQGKEIKQLIENAIVGGEGFFMWDGTTNSGSKARVGYYMIIMEVISRNGHISYIRKKIAIGSRF